MTILPGRAAIIDNGPHSEREGTRSSHMPISRAMGALDIAQIISAYDSGVAPARRNPTGEEVIYIVRGTGACYIDGHRYPLERGVGVYIPPGSVYQIENSAEEVSSDDLLETVSVVCPEDDAAEIGLSPVTADPLDTTPFRTVREDQEKPISAGDRTFKLLVSRRLGCQNVTQFAGVIPSGRAPMHHHPYEEAIYILQGEGRVWIDDAAADFKAGTSIYLPRGVSHCLENTGAVDVRLLGVFHPSGSPGEAYED
jgi:mannose-6-phosphate isomerase-like protein (cupin superfamily)